MHLEDEHTVDTFGKRQGKRNGVGKGCEIEPRRGEDGSEGEDVGGRSLLDGQGKGGRLVGVKGVKIAWHE
jgi:hypothetical protein